MGGTAGKPRKARLSDVAKVAGVGIATVDRVINDRGQVAPETARKIINAARKLNLQRILPAPYRRSLRIEALIARHESDFTDRLKREFRRAEISAARTAIIEMTHIDEDRPHDVAARIINSSCDGMILFAHEHPEVIYAVNERAATGSPIVTIVSDLPETSRLTYVGNDHYKVGRSAAFFMARMIRSNGVVAVFCHNFDYSAHAKRIEGFRDAITLHSPGTEILGIFGSADLESRAEALLIKEFRSRGSAIVGIYNTGAGNRAIASAIARAEDERCISERPIFIAHEATAHNKRMLADGILTLVVDQNPQLQVAKAIEGLLKYFGYFDHDGTPESRIPFNIVTSENL